MQTRYLASISFEVLMMKIISLQAILSEFCCFNSIKQLAQDADFEQETEQDALLMTWSQLWDCAGQHFFAPPRKRQHSPAHYHRDNLIQTHLGAQLRHVMGFARQAHGLEQRLLCGHLTGASEEPRIALLPHNGRLPSTMRITAIVLFLFLNFRKKEGLPCLLSV